MAGFECSTFLWKDQQRKDYVKITGHERHLADDYRCMADLGMGVVREAIRWPVVDQGQGRYDWSSVDPVIDSLNQHRLAAIWDLCHYGLPDNCDPFSDDCLPRFTEYCRHAAEYLVARSRGPWYFTPVNEITFFSAAATDMGWMYPFAKGRNAELKRLLCRFAIEAAKCIREVIPDARMVHVDPMIHAVAPPDRPDLHDEAWKHAYEEAYEAWDILCGKKNPEFGGSEDILDIVGVNVYNFSQAQMNADGSREVLGPRDPRRKPLADMLLFAWERYKRPIIIGETSGYQDKRAEWLRMTMQECMIAINRGVDLHGVCLYPFVDIPDWQSGEWAKIGVYDVEDRESCKRIPCDSYIAELRRWQHMLDQPEHYEADSLDGSGPGVVQLQEVKKHAKEWEARKAGRGLDLRSMEPPQSQ